MRRILLIICFVVTCVPLLAQGSFQENNETIHRFIDKYSDLEDITTIEIGPAMIKIMAMGQLLQDVDDAEATTLLNSIKSIDIMVESTRGKSHITGEMFALPEVCEGFELITKIKDSGEVSNFYFAAHPDDDICEFLMLVRQFDQRVMLYITGNFSIADISALSALGGGI